MKNKFRQKLQVQLYTTLAIYASVGFIIALLSNYIFDTFPSYFFEWLSLRMDIVYILYLIVGFCAIFYYYWKKPWKYLDEIKNVIDTVYQLDENNIELSEPLSDIQNQMNKIKMSMMLNYKALSYAENKKDELVMYLAHDIRTPLTSIIGYLSLLDDSPEILEEQRAKYVGIALKGAKRLETLIKEFFEITRLNSSKSIALKKENIDLHYMLIQMIEEFKPVLESQGKNINLNGSENLKVYADVEKLARVFNNIFTNAIAYSYPDTDINIFVELKNNKIAIIFENQGKTLTKEQLDIIFNKFIRLDESRKSDTGGAGLGLSIAMGIIKLHDGEISAESENETIRIIITLPAIN